MAEVSVCEKCGLKAVRHELERQGVIMKFFDSCYWGEVDPGATPPPGPLRETDVPTPGTKPREK
ncbi:MAG TPA: hypothetical protein VEW91_11275 [bacterium]|nr:hypothetical protein [bacterium]